MKLRVLFLTNIPSPYRVDFFNELGKDCDLTVLFEIRAAKDRDGSWISENLRNFNAVFLKGIRTGAAEAFCPGVLKYLSGKKYDAIIVGMYSSPTGMLAIEYMKLRKIPFILNSDGGIIKEDSGMRHRIKSHFISAASAWLSTGKVTTEYLCYYGAKRDRVFVYPFTSVKKQDVLRQPLSHEEKKAYKAELNIKEEQMILSVGQFIYRKGYDILLNACVDIPGNAGVYIVGGEATEEYLELKRKLGLTNVHFIGFQKKDVLTKYYRAADIFVLPTREDIWGLVINEAMAQGLPVISSDKCVAATELVKGNGIIIESTKENLSEAINTFLRDTPAAYAKKSLDIMRNCTIESMAEVHISILNNWSRIK